jgi:hypothetical protein
MLREPFSSYGCTANVRPALLVVAIAALAMASGASAKNMTVAQACGPDDCVRLEDRQAVTTLLGGGGSTPPPTAVYYRLDFTFESPDGAQRVTHSSLYVPLTHLAATEGRTGDVVWFPVDRAAAGLMDRATRDLQPFAAPSAWPTRYADRVFTRTTRTAAGNEAGWTPWLLAGVAVLLALGLGAFLAQARLRRPEIA